MSAGEILLNAFFYVFALVALGGALAVAISTNIVRSAFALLAVLFAAAAFYAFMRADFVFAAQILIYVGGILVLIIFAIMLTHRITDVKVSNDSSHGPAAFFACLCVLFSLVVVIATYKWNRGVAPTEVEVAGDTAAKRPPVRLHLGMLQGDGKTGAVRGGMILEGRGFLTVETRELPPGWTGARIQIARAQKAAKAGDPPPWVAHKWAEGASTVEARDLPLEAKPAGAHAASLELTGLPAGKYRWSVALVPEAAGASPSPAAGFGASGESAACDFTVEAGLSRPIGMALMGPYLLPFEVVSVLLLAALIGAAFLARKEVKP